MLALLALACFSTVKAHDFEVDGLYYNIISEKDSTCHITFRGEDYLHPCYDGSLIIPGQRIFPVGDE